jgi:hypothetical protein
MRMLFTPVFFCPVFKPLRTLFDEKKSVKNRVTLSHLKDVQFTVDGLKFSFK